eukprot:2222341-Pleurochrysis_carterae.AAC.2
MMLVLVLVALPLLMRVGVVDADGGNVGVGGVDAVGCDVGDVGGDGGSVGGCGSGADVGGVHIGGQKTEIAEETMDVCTPCEEDALAVHAWRVTRLGYGTTRTA